ncbi:unnamed protein product [Pylaiella littoralis]
MPGFFRRPLERKRDPPGQATQGHTQKAAQGLSKSSREVLLTFFEATNGPAWKVNSGWGTDADISDWCGVSVDIWGRVFKLELSGNELNGTIPPELGELQNLMHLDLSHNFLKGTIPTKLRELERLWHLDLSRNSLEGTIPTEVRELHHLWHLDLSHNSLTGTIRAELGELHNLMHLDLSHNYLQGTIPTEVGKPRHLLRLDLSHNSLQGTIPTELAKLQTMVHLDLSHNYFEGTMPTEIGELRSLKTLDLNHNSFEGNIPSSLGNLENLAELILGNNQLGGTIPTELGKCGRLQNVDLSHNYFEGKIPTAITRLYNLRNVDVRHNPLLDLSRNHSVLLNLFEATNGPAWKVNSGWGTDADISDWYGVSTDAWGHVVKLELSGNGLNGAIPRELGELQDPLHLDLSHNSLRGTMPTELGELRSMEALDLSHNSLDGNIPSSMGNLENLAKLILGNNELGGTIPTELGKCGRLQKVDLSHNYVEGKIPTTITRLFNLRNVDVRNNPLLELSRSHSVLLTFFKATNGPAWKVNSGWGTDADISDWHGVSVDNWGRVVKLELSGNGLNGTIPTELEGLQDLLHLDLSHNSLQGTIPTELRKLERLWHLNISHNFLEGTIPTEFRELERLWHLDLSHNSLEDTIPRELGELESLMHLNLGHNSFKGTIPRELGQPQNLLHLDLSHNSLQGTIPAEVGELQNLMHLDFSHNSLKGVILREPGELQNMMYLDLSHNSLKGTIPRELGEPENLYHLDLSHNSLKGTIPPEFGELQNLMHLDLSHNSLKGTMPTELGELCNLRTLDVSHNSLDGNIPSSLGNLEKFEELILGNNQLGGTIPTELGKCGRLQKVDLSHNYIKGKIPTAITRLFNLRNVDVRHNPLLDLSRNRSVLLNVFEVTNGPAWKVNTGWGTDADISDWYGVSVDNWGRVVKLELSGNGLNGTIPTEFEELQDLLHLDLSHNSLKGTIPTELEELRDLLHLDLSHNSLEGTIPTELGELERLWHLDLSHNSLKGTIPTELGELERLWHLDLSHNHLERTTPTELRALQNLMQLDLSHNFLTGTIPTELEELQKLMHLDLSHNSIEGTIPTELGEVRNLWHIDLSHNSLEGTIPTELGKPRNLLHFDLSHNFLRGTIPTKFGKLQNLMHLDLSHNSLKGTMPTEVGKLCNLKTLDLSHNSLEGTIPSSLGNLEKFEELILGNNQLGGTIPTELGKCGRLQKVDLSHNHIEGKIPTDTTRLYNLRNVDVRHNPLLELSRNRSVLITFFEATNGPAWKVNTGWGTDTDISDWYGVSVDAWGHVVKLELSGNGLNGAIPRELGELQGPLHLDLSHNSLRGTIPTELGKLCDLETLDLSHNSLEGNIPSSLGNLENLSELILGNNQLEGTIPTEVGKLYSLETLDLGHNYLEGTMPTEIGNLYRMETLDLCHNYLEGTIPTEVGKLRSLETLDLSHNSLEGTIPTELGKCWRLKKVDLGLNYINGKFATDVTRLLNLRNVDVRHNPLQNLSKSSREVLLTFFEATNGSAWKVNSGWGTTADISHWYGVSVDTWGRVSKLELSGNGLNGTIPRELGELERLWHLDLGHNSLEGNIPASLGNLKNLLVLILRNNQLGGTIPTDLGELGGVRRLDLSHNSLEGDIPASLGNLKSLAELILGNNQLRGIIPIELGECWRLQKIDLSHNSIKGNIPRGIGRLSVLRSVDVSHNPLLESSESDRAALLALFESTNRHGWKISTFWGTGTDIAFWHGVEVDCEGHVDVLHLYDNNLSGKLPAALGNLHHLRSLKLQKNRLAGKIPTELGGLRRLEVMSVSENYLVGELPAALGNLQRLRTLNLINNGLAGFPKEVAASLLQLENMPTVAVRENPWENPPQAVVEAGLKAIVRYFEDIERSGSLKSWMLKVVLVGAVCAGKSSVVQSLIAGKPRPVPLARRTRGVDVHVEHPFKPDASKPVEFVFWDFAGHDDYHSTHSLFLSTGALFLLVVDLARFVDDPSSRGDSIYIWLDTLLCRIPGAVIQIVVTHTDDERIDDQEGAVEELREVVADHLAAKSLEHERGWEKRGSREGDMPAPPNLKIIHKIHAVSCTTGNDWPAFGEAMAHLAAEGTAEYLYEPFSNAGQTTGQKESKLFLSVGKNIPTVWARAYAVMNALRDGTDPGHAATLPPEPGTWNGMVAKAQVGYVSWEEAVQGWEKAIAVSGFSNEIGPEGATAVLKDMIRLKVCEGIFLFENGLLHLDPKWLNDLLRAIMDHRLQDPSTLDWERELEAYADRHKLGFDRLSNTHQTFCAKGTLTVIYLKFLWREVMGIQQGGVFDRLLETLMTHGVLFSDPNCFFPEPEAALNVEMGAALFVPVRLQRYTSKDRLAEFSALCHEWRRQLVYRVRQRYVPPGIIGMLMARLLVSEDVELHCAWSRGLAFMMGGSEVMLYLNPPEAYDRNAEIEVNVVGPTRSDEVEVKVVKLQNGIEKVLRDNFPGLNFDLEGGQPRTLKGRNALMDRIDTLEKHLDVRLDSIEVALANMAKSSRQSLMRLKTLQTPNYPYPHLVVISEHQPTSNTAGSGRKKRILSKTHFRSLLSSVRTVGRKEMRLQFLCPSDFSEVPCGPGGQGYCFGETRDWVKKVFPAMQVTLVIAKVALKAVSGLDLEVSDFLNAVKGGIGQAVADRALDEEALRRVMLGEEVAGTDIQGVSRASYEALQAFMAKEEERRRKHARPGDGYVDFGKEMKRVADGKGGMVWISNRNVQRWLDSHQVVASP